MPLNSVRSVLARLQRGKNARRQFVESHLNKTVAYQIRSIRDRLGWSQERLAKEVGMNQNAISRLESPDYGKPTLTTLKRLATAFDVALVVRFVPFSELVDWVTSNPHTVKGLSTESLAIPDFETEQQMGALGNWPIVVCLKPQYDLSNAQSGHYFAAIDPAHTEITQSNLTLGNLETMNPPRKSAATALYRVTQETSRGEINVSRN